MSLGSWNEQRRLIELVLDDHSGVFHDKQTFLKRVAPSVMNDLLTYSRDPIVNRLRPGPQSVTNHRWFDVRKTIMALSSQGLLDCLERDNGAVYWQNNAMDDHHHYNTTQRLILINVASGNDAAAIALWSLHSNHDQQLATDVMILLAGVRGCVDSLDRWWRERLNLFYVSEFVLCAAARNNQMATLEWAIRQYRMEPPSIVSEFAARGGHWAAFERVAMGGSTHVVSAMVGAAANGHIEFVRRLLKIHPNLLDCTAVDRTLDACGGGSAMVDFIVEHVTLSRK